MADFTVAAAQVPSVRGDIAANIATHTRAMAAAAAEGVSLLVFPELSLTGYEPDLASDLAFAADDRRLAPLVAAARAHRLTVVAGAPLQNAAGKPSIGAIVAGADGATTGYRKMHLGTSEGPFFAPGHTPLWLTLGGYTTGLAVCADTSQASHPETYAAQGAGIYAAGVFLDDEWYATDAGRFPAYAARLGMLVVMANHGASVGTLTSVGKSAIWKPDGGLLVSAAGVEPVLLLASPGDGGWRGRSVPVPAA